MRGLLLPERTFGRALLLRSLAVWLPARVLLAATVLLGDGGVAPADAVFLSPRMALGVALAAAFLAMWDTRRRNEHLLLANLGVGPAAQWGLALVPALLGEVVFQLLGA